MLSHKIASTGLWSFCLCICAFGAMVWAGDRSVSPQLPEITRNILMWMWISFIFVLWIAKMVQVWFESKETE